MIVLPEGDFNVVIKYRCGMATKNTVSVLSYWWYTSTTTALLLHRPHGTHTRRQLYNYSDQLVQVSHIQRLQMYCYTD